MVVRPSTSPRRVALVAGLVVLILGLGAGAYAVASSVFSTEAPSGTAAGARPSAPVTTQAPAGKKAHPVRGRITAINGSTWTVRPAKGGGPISVIVSDRTKFGPKKAPTTSADFPVGTRIAVVGPRVGDRIEATRIMIPQTAPSAAPAG